MKWEKIKDLVRGPKRHYNKIKTTAFGTGYRKTVQEYEKITLNAILAAKELELGIIGSSSIKFFQGRVLKRFFSKEEKGKDLLFKERTVEMVVRWKQGQCLKEDADWLVEDFIPYLQECEARDVSKLVKMFKFEKGVPIEEEN